MKIILVTSLLLLIDQITKILVRTYLSLYESITLIPSFLNFTYVQNTGAAFSILEGKQIIFIIASIIALI